MSDKYVAKNANNPLKDQKLTKTRGFDEYPDWALFKGEDGKDYSLKLDMVEEIKDDEDQG